MEVNHIGKFLEVDLLLTSFMIHHFIMGLYVYLFFQADNLSLIEVVSFNITFINK